MQITKKFLLDNRTKSNAWTREQFRIIGLTWPPKQNWMSLVKDKELTGAQVAEFIRAKDKPAMSLTKLEKCYLGVMDGLKRLSVGQLVILRDEINKTLSRIK
tara:strand:+ start:859 stop:1164 length:306 start_codon:yes stop_codon:yes gene_type:complete